MRILFVAFLMLLGLSLPLLAARKPDARTMRLFELKIGQSADAFNRADYDKAERLALEAEAIFPDQDASINLIGAVYYKRKEYDKALVKFQAILDKSPRSYTAIFNFGEVLFAQKKYDDALKRYQELHDTSPEDELVHFKLVVTKAIKGDRKGAEADLATFAKPGQTAASYYAQAALQFIDGKSKEAQKWIDKSVVFFSPENSVNYHTAMVECGWLPK